MTSVFYCSDEQPVRDKCFDKRPCCEAASFSRGTNWHYPSLTDAAVMLDNIYMSVGLCTC